LGDKLLALLVGEGWLSVLPMTVTRLPYGVRTVFSKVPNVTLVFEEAAFMMVGRNRFAGEVDRGRGMIDVVEGGTKPQA
jgi:hypothetical protein